MAKGVGLLGNIKGKLGNAVGYQIRNSNNRTTQGFRVYQPEVANPKTSGQAAQRMKMSPAVLFYRAFSELLDHSWEGVKYGGQSHQYFMKMVMRNTFTGYPYLPLGTNFMVPGSYPMSRGSLAGFEIASFTDGKAYTNVKSPFEATGATVGSVSQALIGANAQLQNGDQLTFAWVVATGNETSPYAIGFTRLILDVDSPIAFADSAVYQYISWNPEGTLHIDVTGFVVVGAAVIVSRFSDGQWLRSNANLALFESNAALADYFTTQQYEFARKTYEEQIPITSSKWYLNQATGRSESETNTPANGGALVVTANLTLEGGETINNAFFNGVDQSGYIFDSPSLVNNPQGDGTIQFRQVTLQEDTKKLVINNITGYQNAPAGIRFVDLADITSILTEAGYTIGQIERP